LSGRGVYLTWVVIYNEWRRLKRGERGGVKTRQDLDLQPGKDRGKKTKRRIGKEGFTLRLKVKGAKGLYKRVDSFML